jgi:hypothetical protein
MGQNFSCVDKLKKEDFKFVETKNTYILEFFLVELLVIFFYTCIPFKNMFLWVLVHYTNLSTTCPIHFKSHTFPIIV